MEGPDNPPRFGHTGKANMMKTLWSIPIGAALALGACARNAETAQDTGATPTTLVSLSSETVEVGCGKCVYDIPGVTSCVLAAKIGDHAVLVTGAEVELQDHGLCEDTGTALVSGRLEGDTFVATTVEMQ